MDVGDPPGAASETFRGRGGGAYRRERCAYWQPMSNGHHLSRGGIDRDTLIVVQDHHYNSGPPVMTHDYASIGFRFFPSTFLQTTIVCLARGFRR